MHKFYHTRIRDVIVSANFETRVLESFFESFSIDIRAFAFQLPGRIKERLVVEDHKHSATSVVKIVFIWFGWRTRTHVVFVFVCAEIHRKENNIILSKCNLT